MQLCLMFAGLCVFCAFCVHIYLSIITPGTSGRRGLGHGEESYGNGFGIKRVFLNECHDFSFWISSLLSSPVSEPAVASPSSL